MSAGFAYRSQEVEKGVDWTALLVALATAMLARVALGYLPFPSVDDFAYAPLAQMWLEPGLFARDDLLQAFSNHALGYAALYAFFERTVGIGLGFLTVTLALSIATSVAILGIMRSLGVRGLMLPLVFAIAVVVQIRGLGRGEYGGLFGDAVHMQWVAQCILLFTFQALLRGRAITAGICLGLAALAHPMVAAHGAFIVLCGALCEGAEGLRKLVKMAGIAMLVALPMEVSVLGGLLGGSSGDLGVPVSRIIEEAYIFRTPHHYELKTGAVILTGFYAILGVLSLVALRGLGLGNLRAAFGLLAGMLLLFGSTVLYFSEDLSWPGQHASLIPYILDLSRTSPLLIVYSAILFGSAVERIATGGGWVRPLAVTIAGLGGLLVVFLIFYFNSRVDLWVSIALFLTAATILAHRAGTAHTLVIAGWTLGGALALATFLLTTPTEARVDRADAELYGWARNSTAQDALFIVPPSFMQFRHYARRGVYADFKLFSVAQPYQGWMIRERLELISAPDAETRQAKGWDGLKEWDLSYARHNNARRAAWLLAQTGADYLVHDLRLAPRSGVAVGAAEAELTLVFENERYLVFAKDGAD